MTEEEAKTKWCPFFRSAISIDGHNREYTTNRDDLPMPGGSRCIASACMAWRDHGHAWASDKPLGGYCGLAGNP